MSHRTVAVVTTCRNDDIVTAMSTVLPGVSARLVHNAGKRAGIVGVSAAIFQCPRREVGQVSAQLRRLLREATSARTVLVGIAVDDSDNDEQLLRLAAEALISGHGVASDHEVIRRRLRRSTAVSGARGWLRHRYAGCTTTQQRWFLGGLTLLAGLVAPFLGYCAANLFGLDLAGPASGWCSPS